MTMSWIELLFAHWRVDADRLAAVLPEGLELDTFEGEAWLGVVPFRMENVTGRYLPNIPGVSAFPELNVRTYVVAEGKPGVWFLSLDAAQRLAVWGARTFFDLPYFNARMHCTKGDDGWVDYACTREDERLGAGSFEGRYRGVGPQFHASPGTLEAWLTERYCLYAAAPDGSIGRGEIHHASWPLQEAEADVEVNTIVDAHGLELHGAPLLHYVERIDVVGWLLQRLRTT